MAIDSKDDNHQPKGTPNAGRFAPKALKHSFDRLAVEYRKALAPVEK